MKFRRVLLACIFLASCVFLAEALDPPHYDPGVRYCEDCHKEASQPSVPALCTTCHVEGGVASNKPFKYTPGPLNPDDQVEIGVRGLSHRFDSEGLKYVKMRKNCKTDSRSEGENSNNDALECGTGIIKIRPDSVYQGDFETQNEMEYEFEILNDGDVGTATFRYRCRIRSKRDVDTNGPWIYEKSWGAWTTNPLITSSDASLTDECGLGVDPGISLSFEDSTGRSLSNDGGSGWAFKREITITGSKTGQNSYPVLVTLTLGEMDIDSNNSYNNVKADGSDIRFTNSTGTELDYWIESWDNTGESKVWVEVDSLNIGSTKIYLYYGNPAASNSSDGKAAFIHFDDFSSDTTADYTWTSVGSSTHKYSETYKWAELRTCIDCEMNVSKTINLPYSGFAKFEMVRRGDYDGPGRNEQKFKIIQDSSNYYQFRLQGANGTDQGFSKFVMGAETDSIVGAGTVDADDAVYTVEIWWTPGSMRMDLSVFGKKTSHSITTTNNTRLKPSSFGFNNLGIDQDWRYIYIGKYLSDNPIVSAPGPQLPLHSNLPSFVTEMSGRVYIKLLNKPDNLSMRTRTQEIDYKDKNGNIINAKAKGVPKINCAVCHNQHFHEKDRPYLRIKNIRNSLCKHCHSDREKSHFVLLSGTATGGGNWHVEDTKQNWNVNEWVGKMIYFQKNFGGFDYKEIILDYPADFNPDDPTKQAKDGNGNIIDRHHECYGLNQTQCENKAPGIYCIDILPNDSNRMERPIACQEIGRTSFTTEASDTQEESGFYRYITSNTATILQWDGRLGNVSPDFKGYKYKIVDPKNVGSHPLGVPYRDMDMDKRFNASTGNLVLDDNETPDDPTDDTVQCMTCHSPHFAHTIDTLGGEAFSGDETSVRIDTSYPQWPKLEENELVGQELRIFNEFIRWKTVSGTVSSGTAISLKDSSKNWEEQAFIGAKVEVQGEVREIVSNTTDTIFWQAHKPLSSVAIGSYTIYHMAQIAEKGIAESGTKTSLTPYKPGVVKSGLATSGAGNYLADSIRSWISGAFAGERIEVYNLIGESLGQRTIVSNTTTTLSWDLNNPFREPIVPGFRYDIIPTWQGVDLTGSKVEIFTKTRKRIGMRIIASHTSDTITWTEDLDLPVINGYIYHIYKVGGEERGFASSGGENIISLTDATQTWQNDEFVGAEVVVTRKRTRPINPACTSSVSFKICWDDTLNTKAELGDVYYIFDNNGKVIESGSALDGGKKFLIDTNKDFSTLDLTNTRIRMYQTNNRIISSNTSDTIRWDDLPSEAYPDPLTYNVGDEYYIRYRNPNWREKRIITANTADTIHWNSSEPLRASVNPGDIIEIADIAGSVGKGYILDKANDETLCMTCHSYQSHFLDADLGRRRNCRDCHTPHNTTNRFLIKEYVNNRRVHLRPGDNYVRSDRKGICQVCHTRPRHWRNEWVGTPPDPNDPDYVYDPNNRPWEDHYTNGCPQCHDHADRGAAWKYNCGQCHGKPPLPIGTRVDQFGNIVGSDGKIFDVKANNGSRVEPRGEVREYNKKNQEILPSVRKFGETFKYRVEDWDNGGGAHLVHVIGKGFMCKKCHGHNGFGPEHGGSVGRWIPERKNLTFNFDLDFSLNQHDNGKPVTQIGYHKSSYEKSVYPKIILGTDKNAEERETGTADHLEPVNTMPLGPGPIDLGDGGFTTDVFNPALTDGQSQPESDIRNPVRCKVGCHNPRRLYLQDEPVQDMVNIFQWNWFFPMEGCRDNPDCDETANNLPRDEVPDVPCPKCHDAQATLVQGSQTKDVYYDPYPKGSNKQKILSGHPVSVDRRDDCRVCHDYYNPTKVHTEGYVYLRNKDDDSSPYLWDPKDTSSLEPFCLSCHDADGATTELVPRSPFSRERAPLGDIKVPDIKAYWDKSVHANIDKEGVYKEKMSCFSADGLSGGCHGNPHGSAQPSLLARYNDNMKNEKYFCYNCHGYGINFSPVNPYDARPTPAPAIRDQMQKRYTNTGSGHPVPVGDQVEKHRRTESTITSEKHAECVDCHDPMSDNNSNRLEGQRYVNIDGTPWDPGKDRVSGDHPMAGNVQLGDPEYKYIYWNAKAEVDNPPEFKYTATPPPHGQDETYYVRQPYVYEVCFRCHGPNYATFFKDRAPFPDNAPDRVGTGHFSDKRKEFDPRSQQYADYPNHSLGVNTSYHPVAAPGRNATQPLFLQLKDAFGLMSKEDLKTLTMVCTDCHNNDALTELAGPATYSNLRDSDKRPKVISGWNNYSWDNMLTDSFGNRTDDKQRQSNLRIGPHGSLNPRILRAPYNTNVYYDQHSRGDYNSIKGGFALCFKCHKESVLISTDGTGGTNFGSSGNGWWVANLHAEHLTAPTYTGQAGGGAVCHECHQNVHSNVEAVNTIYGDGRGGMLPPDSEDGILDGISSTHLINFGPSVTGSTALKPRWYWDGWSYRCNLYCHGMNMDVCYYKHGAAGTLNSWCNGG